jgi:hypothetical protein
MLREMKEKKQRRRWRSSQCRRCCIDKPNALDKPQIGRKAESRFQGISVNPSFLGITTPFPRIHLTSEAPKRCASPLRERERERERERFSIGAYVLLEGGF